MKSAKLKVMETTYINKSIIIYFTFTHHKRILIKINEFLVISSVSAIILMFMCLCVCECDCMFLEIKGEKNMMVKEDVDKRMIY